MNELKPCAWVSCWLLGCGVLGLYYLAIVASFPHPDDKIRSTSHFVQGGGNAGNALTGAARLGLKPRLISKVANDASGRSILEELEADGVDTSYIVISEGNSPFTYVIVDSQRRTRACMHTAGHSAMVPDDLSQSKLMSAPDGARIFYSDVRFHETGLVIAKQVISTLILPHYPKKKLYSYFLDGSRIFYSDVRLHETALVIAKQAAHMRIPIIIDAVRKREGLEDLLDLADYVVCSAKFPQAWTEAPSIPSALLSMLLRLPQVKFVVVTLGENGCVMLERNINAVGQELEEVDIDSLLESLKQGVDAQTAPTCVYSKPMMQLSAVGVGSVCGWLLFGTSEVIPTLELIDTTGAGDAFIGAFLYCICAEMPPEKMLPFAAQVAATSCRALGARTGLPRGEDPRLASFLC